MRCTRDRRAPPPLWVCGCTLAAVQQHRTSLRAKAFDHARGLEWHVAQMWILVGVLPVAHIAVVPPERVATRFADATRFVPVDAPGELVYDHPDIIELAVADVRARYAASPDPDRLLGEEFTLRDLRLVREVIAGHVLQRDTFRRAMQRHLEPTGLVMTGGCGRPAELFRRT